MCYKYNMIIEYIQDEMLVNHIIINNSLEYKMCYIFVTFFYLMLINVYFIVNSK